MPEQRRNESQRHDAKRKRMVDKWRRIPLGERRRRKGYKLKSKPYPNTVKPYFKQRASTVWSQWQGLSVPSQRKDTPYRPGAGANFYTPSIPKSSEFFKGFCKQKDSRQE
jgi:hypothetical protein